MRVYIIATESIKDNITGYVLMDIEDRFKIIKVSKSSLLSAMRNNQIKIENAVLVDNKFIRGKDYSLKSLVNIREQYRGLEVLGVCSKGAIICAVDTANSRIEGNIIELNKALMHINTPNLNVINRQIVEEAVNNQAHNNIKNNINYESNKNKIESIRINENRLEIFIENNISLIDTRETRLKQQKEVRLLIANDISIDKLIISDEIEKLVILNNKPAKKQLTVNIKEVQFENRDKTKKVFKSFGGSSDIELTIGKTNMPMRYEIYSCFNRCHIKEIDFTLDAGVNHEIYNSFSKSIIENEEIKIEGIDLINLSFISTEFKKVILCGNKMKVNNSFRALNKHLDKNIEIQTREPLVCSGSFYGYIIDEEVIVETSAADYIQGSRIGSGYRENLCIVADNSTVSLDEKRIPRGEQFIINHLKVELGNGKYKQQSTTILELEIITGERVKTINELKVYIQGMAPNKIIWQGNVKTLNGMLRGLRTQYKSKEEITKERIIETIGDSFEQDIYISGNMKIDEWLTHGIDLERILPDSVEILEKGTLSNCLIKEFDSTKFKSLRVIGERVCFNSNIPRVIIGDNIKKLGDNAFNCSNMEYIYVSDKVKEIGKLAISGNLFTKYYLHKDSLAYKEVSKRSAAIIIEITSEEEARRLIDEDMNRFKNDTTDKLLKKAKVLTKVSNDEDLKVMNSERYIGGYEQLVSIKKEVVEKIPICTDRVVLDTSKFRTLYKSNNSIIRDIISSSTDEQITLEGYNIKAEGSNKVSNKEFIDDEFKIISNFITNTYERVDEFYRDDIEQYIELPGNFEYLNDYCIDTVYNTNSKNYILNVRDIAIKIGEGKYTISLIIIVYRGEVEYVAMAEIDNAVYEISKNRHNTKVNMLQNRTAVTRRLKKEDIIDRAIELRIGGHIYPREIRDKYSLDDKIKQNLILLGKSTDIKIACQLDLYTGNIIVMDYTQCMIIDIVRPDETIDKIDNRYFGIIDKDTMSVIKAYINGETEEIERIESDISNYNTFGYVELANLVNMLGMFDVNKLAFINEILHSEYTWECNFTINKTTERQLKIYNKHELGDGYAVIDYEYRGNGLSIHILVLKKNGRTYNKTVRYSIISFNNILKAIKGLYESRQSMQLESDKGITNEKINIDKYYIYDEIIVELNAGSGHKILLGTDKMNCDTYIIYEILDTDFYSLFRFKNIRDAYACLDMINMIERTHHRSIFWKFDMDNKFINKTKYLKNKEYAEVLNSDFNYLISSIRSKKDGRELFNIIRKAIMDGQTDIIKYNHCLEVKQCDTILNVDEFIDSLAKQPK